MTTPTEIKEGLAAVETLQKIQAQLQNDGKELVDFVQRNREQLRAENLEELIEVVGIYGDTYHAYHNALTEFLAAYKAELEYSQDHSDAISRNRYPETSRYEGLYSKYEFALERQNQAYLAHLTFVENYAKQHPSISAVLGEIVSQQRPK